MSAPRKSKLVVAKRTVAITALVLLVFALTPIMPVSANHPDPYTISLQSAVFSSGETTYTWIVEGPDGGDVSHVVINTCLGETAVDVGGDPDDSPTWTDNDPTTDKAGYKWGTAPVGSTFILTFAGNTGTSGTADWTIKKGNHRDDPLGDQKSGTTAGPSCESTFAIDIHKFDDLDGNQQQDLGEGDLSGWVFDLFEGSDCQGNSIATSSATDSNGETSFEDLSPGDYSVGEQTQVGWQNTTGLCLNVTISDADSETLEFGNRLIVIEQSLINVHKFNDLNGNQQQDQGEGDLSGWVFDLFEGSDCLGTSIATSAATDLLGERCSKTSFWGPTQWESSPSKTGRTPPLPARTSRSRWSQRRLNSATGSSKRNRKRSRAASPLTSSTT